MGRRKKTEAFSYRKAVAIIGDLRRWMKADEQNAFIDRFLFERDIYQSQLQRIVEQYEDLRIPYEECKLISAMRIRDNCLSGKWSGRFGMFLLSANHGYVPQAKVLSDGRVQHDVADGVQVAFQVVGAAPDKKGPADAPGAAKTDA